MTADVKVETKAMTAHGRAMEFAVTDTAVLASLVKNQVEALLSKYPSHRSFALGLTSP